MGGLISLVRDIKTVYKDLKVTLKLTARIVLKVHGIVDDVEQTVQELKTAVKGLSSKLNPAGDGKGEVAFDALVENVESKAILLKTSLIEATSQMFNEDLFRSTQEKWDRVMEYSKQSTEALANMVASSSLNINRHETSISQHEDIIEESASLSEVKEKENQQEEANSHNNLPLIPVSEILPIRTNAKSEEAIQDFEILPIEITNSFWKCDIGCFNIDCVDFQHLPASQLTDRDGSEKLRKKKAKKRNKYSKKPKAVRKVPSSIGSDHTPGNMTKHHHSKRKQSRENVALEMIFLLALLVEGVAISNSDLMSRASTWNERHNVGSAAEIIELDD